MFYIVEASSNLRYVITCLLFPHPLPPSPPISNKGKKSFREKETVKTKIGCKQENTRETAEGMLEGSGGWTDIESINRKQKKSGDSNYLRENCLSNFSCSPKKRTFKCNRWKVTKLHFRRPLQEKDDDNWKNDERWMAVGEDECWERVRGCVKKDEIGGDDGGWDNQVRWNSIKCIFMSRLFMSHFYPRFSVLFPNFANFHSLYYALVSVCPPYKLEKQKTEKFCIPFRFSLDTCQIRILKIRVFFLIHTFAVAES